METAYWSTLGAVEKYGQTVSALTLQCIHIMLAMTYLRIMVVGRFVGVLSACLPRQKRAWLSSLRQNSRNDPASWVCMNGKNQQWFGNRAVAGHLTVDTGVGHGVCHGEARWLQVGLETSTSSACRFSTLLSL